MFNIPITKLFLRDQVYAGVMKSMRILAVSGQRRKDLKLISAYMLNPEMEEHQVKDQVMMVHLLLLK